MTVRTDRSTRAWTLSTPAETRAAGRELAADWDRPRTVALIGPLGAGKTTFVRGVVEARGGDPDGVRSPTYTLLREHPGARPSIVHADLYRVEAASGQRTIGIEDCFDRALLLVEWADRWTGSWPASTGTVRLEHTPQGERRMTWSASPPGANRAVPGC